MDINKLKGKHIQAVVERMQLLGTNYRVVQEHGLITMEHDPTRYSLMINKEDIIIDAVMG